MLEHLKNEADLTRTENGAVAHSTSGSECLDFFATAGAIRRESAEEIEKRFVRAFSENRDIAMKLLFFARDIRGGLGERRVFRVVLRWLAANEASVIRKNIPYVAEYGRFDDILALLDTPCEQDAIRYLKERFDADRAALAEDGEVSLLAKWLPSVNASNAETVAKAKRIARSFGMSDAEYRRALVALRARIRIIENDLRLRSYTFDYSKQPSRAMFKYRQAFMRNDLARYTDFLNKVSSGKAKLHADAVAPYELIAPYLGNFPFSDVMEDISEEEAKVLNATWASLPDFGGEDDSLAVIDTSYSMYFAFSAAPASVALSLGLYFAERNKGRFKNHLIIFSEKPELIRIKGETFVDRLRYVSSLEEAANTNVEAVFDLILRTAVKNSLPASELPARLILISDMEFDQCVDNADSTVFENAKKKFAAQGYALPEIVFWNVACRNGHQPVRMNEQGVALVSGCTPRLFSMIAGGAPDPYAFMMEVVESPRYAPITA